MKNVKDLLENMEKKIKPRMVSKEIYIERNMRDGVPLGCQ
jgi:hypothetical protein